MDNSLDIHDCTPSAASMAPADPTAALENVISRDGYFVRSVHGTSMLPMLDARCDLVKIVALSRPLAVGDLPLYKRPNGQYVLHRIIRVRRDGFVTCGDNRSVPERVPFSWVIGVAEGFYKRQPPPSVDAKYIPCTDPGYLDYVRRRVRRARFRGFFARSRILRGIVRSFRRTKKAK